MKCRLEQIFDAQRELMSNFSRIERTHGLLETPDVPVDLTSFEGQARLRNFAWRIVEEITEANDAWTQRSESPERHAREEIIDALHFLVEFFLLVGVHPAVLVPVDGDRLLEEFSVQASSFPTHVTPRPQPIIAFADFIVQLGRVVNLLKNRPWKQSSRPLDLEMFHRQLFYLFPEFVRGCIWMGLTADDLHAMYFKKHSVNVDRIAKGA